MSRIQQISIANSELTYSHKCNLHAIAVALLALLGRVSGVNNIMEYCEKIIESRQEEADYLLPGLIDPERDFIDSTSLNLPHLMIDKVHSILKTNCWDNCELNIFFTSSWHYPSVFRMPEWKIIEYRQELHTV